MSLGKERVPRSTWTPPWRLIAGAPYSGLHEAQRGESTARSRRSHELLPPIGPPESMGVGEGGATRAWGVSRLTMFLG
jgi:hypothetical protein